MKRVITKIGDIFEVKISDTSKGYFQYIADDMSQLNSAVIRAFSKRYPIQTEVSPEEIINDKIEFHWHTFIKLGVKLGFWRKIANFTIKEEIDQILFRGSKDDGDPKFDIKDNISEKWFVWKINSERVEVGKLGGEYKKAEIGDVLPASTIVHRMRTGKNDFIYPRSE